MPTYRRHLQRPAESFTDYRARRLERLTATVLRRRIIYLDVNYWIDLLAADAGQPRGPEHAELLELLRKGVGSGQLVCPVSMTTALEVDRQRDQSSRKATCKLIDELSLGIALISFDEIISSEVAHFFLSALVPDGLRPNRENVWTRTGIMLVSDPPPPPFALTPRQERALQKTLFDSLWKLSLEEGLSQGAASEPAPFYLLARQLTEGSRAHADEVRTFDDAYRSELKGLVEGSEPMIREAVDCLRDLLGGPPTAGSLNPGWTILLLNALAQSSAARKALPTLHILASLHALVRWNRTQTFKANDFPDFHHAASALAYCDLFLTERGLVSMLSRGPSKLIESSNCEAAWAPSEALSKVRNLLAGVRAGSQRRV